MGIRPSVIIMILGLLCLLKMVESRSSSGVYRNTVDVEYRQMGTCRKHRAALTDFGGVGDGKTSNTKAFKAAIDHLSTYASDGGALLVVPPGKWLTGSFNLTSHFTLFLHKDAVVLASQVGEKNLLRYVIIEIISYIIKRKKY